MALPWAVLKHTLPQRHLSTPWPLSLSLFKDVNCPAWYLLSVTHSWSMTFDILSSGYCEWFWFGAQVCLETSTSQPLIYVTIWVTPADRGELVLVTDYLRSSGFSFFIWPPPVVVDKESLKNTQGHESATFVFRCPSCVEMSKLGNLCKGTSEVRLRVNLVMFWPSKCISTVYPSTLSMQLHLILEFRGVEGIASQKTKETKNYSGALLF